MKNKRWIDILKRKRQLNEDCEITTLTDMSHLYLIEGINVETSVDEVLLVYDCSAEEGELKFSYKEFQMVTEKYENSCPVMVFKTWEHERRVYWDHYNLCKKASEKKEFSNWYNKKFSIYVESDKKVKIEVENQGINYLEYIGDNSRLTVPMKGRIYNISFYELKKLFNVTGTHLFADNVRYGLSKNRTGEQLKSKFREYLNVSIYERATNLSWEKEIIEALKDTLDMDAEFLSFVEDVSGDKGEISGKNILRPENFWFYHNGISIFSYEETLETPGNQIILHPDKTSVINGAQTMTNFYLEVEAAEKAVEKVLIGKKANKDIYGDAHQMLDSVLKHIFVKTVIIWGDATFVRPITHGLNTQIPILEETILAASKVSDEINKCIGEKIKRSNRIKILKEGEWWAGESGVNILDFVKYWLTIHNEPGKSKNLGKKELDKQLQEIAKTLKGGDMTGILKMEILIQVNQWWDRAKRQRLKDYDGETASIIGKYGKNYFGNYVLLMTEDIDSIDDTRLEILYERFIKIVEEISATTELKISLETFKRDELSKELRERVEKEKSEDGRPADPEESSGEVKKWKGLEEEIKELLNREGQSAYTFAKTITNYLLNNNIKIDYFRVISRTGKRCKEAFAFPNSTFNEIAESQEDDYKPFENSCFAKAVRRKFPVFVIDKDECSSENMVSEVHLIEDFSFADYEKEAKKVYEKTVEAFRQGDEGAFIKSGDGQAFHIRPKAIDAEDTFQFTNGNYITKRTFWANKKTIEELIEQKM